MIKLTRFSIVGLFFYLALFAQIAEANASRIVAIVISVSNEKSTVSSITRLPYTANDAEFVLQALTKWSDEDRVIDKLIEGGSGDQPTRQNIMKLVPGWLDEAKADDTVIVFFSGHGISGDKDGQTNYLVPCDVEQKDFVGSCVPIQWLRKELGFCKARSKFLFLDCCHAGGEGTKLDKVESIENIDENFDGVIKSAASSNTSISDVLDVITIAACGAGEKSHYWKEQNISLFSYWLSEALRGAADFDNDQQITSDELFKYVYDNVRKTAQDLGFQQNPIRIVRSGISGDPVVVKTSRPVKTLDEFLEDVARQVAVTMQQKNVTSTGTLEFFASSPNGAEMLARSEFGLLPLNCAEKLQNQLMSHLPKNYMIIRRQMIESRLKETSLSTEQIFTGRVAEVIGTVKFIDRNSIGSFITGKISKTDQNGLVDINCELSGLPNMNALGSYSGRVRLSQVEIANMGQSMRAPKLEEKKQAEISPAVSKPVASKPIANKPTANKPVANEVEKFQAVAATGPGVQQDYRPGLASPLSPPMGFEKDVILPSTAEATNLVPLGPSEMRLFRVRIEVRRGSVFREVQPISVGDRLYIPLERGNVYRIRILNPLSEEVMARVLVDGLNTLPEKVVSPPKTKFIAVADAAEMEYIQSLKDAGALIIQNSRGEYYQVAPPRGLDNARPWKLAPNQEAVVSGFFHDVGVNGKYDEFKVTDAPFSIAGQTRFDTQIGLISVGFFKSVPIMANPQVLESDDIKTRAVGTGAGRRFRIPVRTDASSIAGGILETHQFYYAPRRDILGLPH